MLQKNSANIEDDRRENKYKSSEEFANWLSLLLALLSLIISISSAVSTNYLLILFTRIQRQSPYIFDSVQNRLIGVLFASLIGFSFYVLRQKQRVAYALLEFGAGLGLCYYATAKMADDHKTDAALAAILGCIYIIVRACDNFNQGEKGPLGFLVTRAKKIWYQLFA